MLRSTASAWLLGLRLGHRLLDESNDERQQSTANRSGAGIADDLATGACLIAQQLLQRRDEPRELTAANATDDAQHCSQDRAQVCILEHRAHSMAACRTTNQLHQQRNNLFHPNAPEKKRRGTKGNDANRIGLPISLWN
jgi:hypothetical protein